MQNFRFYNPTQILFGQGQIEHLAVEILKHGRKVLFVYGKGSIKKTGIYAEVVRQLNQHAIPFVELGGVDPNPRISTVRQGAQLCREHQIDFILAVGGGSTIDCSKAIAAAALYDGDPWDFWCGKATIRHALPIGSVLTLSATGSEMNSGTVISNEETLEKTGSGGDALFPRFSILDPAYTFTVPADQTAAGVVDIMTHVYEFYFSREQFATLTDSISEMILKTCIHYGPIAIAEPQNYEARANLMWASSLALNGTIKVGKSFDGFNHLTEHALSAVYDITHGVGLAILAPYWMEYVLDAETAPALAAFARNVWDVSIADNFEAAREGIRRTRQFYTSMGMPQRLGQVGIGADRLDEIVEKAVGTRTIGSLKPLTPADIHRILVLAL
ncbi:MAG: NADH-dependent alcohol dehydrogenase [Chloroflexi bacterium HGW-Chloroflexi-10]|nr:MAG: NADH-dependent alcohol dehydrogenase [Chloroflexi bacterium HGW-Chloroflexi-10]